MCRPRMVTEAVVCHGLEENQLPRVGGEQIAQSNNLQVWCLPGDESQQEDRIEERHRSIGRRS